MLQASNQEKNLNFIIERPKLTFKSAFEENIQRDLK